MTKREQVKYKVDEVLHDTLCIGYNEITDDAVLRDDLGADSLDAVEIVMELEHELDIYIPDDKMHEIYTKYTRNIPQRKLYRQGYVRCGGRVDVMTITFDF